MATQISGSQITTGKASFTDLPYFQAQGPSSDVDIATGNIIQYPGVILNNGNHYNASTYIFTVPVAGLYSFSWDTWHDQASVARLYIMKNGSYYQSSTYSGDRGIHTRHGSLANDEDSSKTVIMECQVGDTVNIYNGVNSGTARIFYSSGFSGYLISAF